MGDTLVHLYIPCVSIIGTVRYSSIRIVPTADQYIGIDR